MNTTTTPPTSSSVRMKMPALVLTLVRILRLFTRRWVTLQNQVQLRHKYILDLLLHGLRGAGGQSDNTGSATLPPPPPPPPHLLFRLLRLTVARRRRRFTDLPYEIRRRVYEFVCTPEADGSCPGVRHLLLLNKAIYDEAKPTFDNIPHTIYIGDGQPMSQSELWGTPRTVRDMTAVGTYWHHRITRLVLIINVCGVGKMSPDTFDVKVSHERKPQWRSLKKLIGIWPETRETPLEQIRVEFQECSPDCRPLMWNADMIRIIRNFKRTDIWAEAGDCSADENTSLLLPLARAMNEARRNWVDEARHENNLFITFNKQVLNGTAKDEKTRKRWEVVPTNDTTRTDNYPYPPLSDVESEYIESKMVKKEDAGVSAVICDRCLACFACRKDYLEHLGRGKARTEAAAKAQLEAAAKKLAEAQQNEATNGEVPSTAPVPPVAGNVS